MGEKILLVMFGGSLGAASRYGVSLLTARVWGTQFPWATLADRVRLLLITGYLGALTTFSSFSLETVNASRSGMILLPLANIMINNEAGFLLTFFGLWLGGLK